MAKEGSAIRRLSWVALLVSLAALWTLPALAAPPSSLSSSLLTMPVARTNGHLRAEDVGLVINVNDPYSVAVGAHYQTQRRLKDDQVLRVALPVEPRLSAAEFGRLKQRIDEHFGSHAQALALAWTLPYAVECESITGALALGLDASFCQQTCGRSKSSPYFNSRSARPWSDHGMRLSMLLAAPSVAEAKALIDRGVAADHSLGMRGAPPAHVHYVATNDVRRNVREPLFPPAVAIPRWGIVIHINRGESPAEKSRVLIYETGEAQVSYMDTVHWLPGALADHLTSFGGLLDHPSGQTTAMAWIAAGATASYGTVSEPCNHLQKFPHPRLLLGHYLQGSTAIEAYWKSVAWPLQGVFVGEPLAAPFAPR